MRLSEPRINPLEEEDWNKDVKEMMKPIIQYSMVAILSMPKADRKLA